MDESRVESLNEEGNRLAVIIDCWEVSVMCSRRGVVGDGAQ